MDTNGDVWKWCNGVWVLTIITVSYLAKVLPAVLTLCLQITVEKVVEDEEEEAVKKFGRWGFALPMSEFVHCIEVLQ